MYISVNGRIAKKKQVEIFIFDVLEHLMPRLKRKVNIDVNIVTRCDNQHYALCLGDKNSAEIELARGDKDRLFTLEEMMLNLAHELVHAKQFAFNEECCEIECHDKEESLFEKHWKN